MTRKGFEDLIEKRKLKTRIKLTFEEIKEEFNTALVYFHTGQLSKDDFREVIKLISKLHTDQEIKLENDHDTHFYKLLDDPFQKEEVWLKYYFTIEILGIEINESGIFQKAKPFHYWTYFLEQYTDKLKVNMLQYGNENHLLQLIGKVLEEFRTKKYSEFFANSVLQIVIKNFSKLFHEIENEKLGDLVLEIDEIEYYLFNNLRDSYTIIYSIVDTYEEIK